MALKNSKKEKKKYTLIIRRERQLRLCGYQILVTMSVSMTTSFSFDVLSFDHELQIALTHFRIRSRIFDIMLNCKI